jgi:hypothetical protein
MVQVRQFGDTDRHGECGKEDMGISRGSENADILRKKRMTSHFIIEENKMAGVEQDQRYRKVCGRRREK